MGKYIEAITHFYEKVWKVDLQCISEFIEHNIHYCPRAPSKLCLRNPLLLLRNLNQIKINTTMKPGVFL